MARSIFSTIIDILIELALKEAQRAMGEWGRRSLSRILRTLSLGIFGALILALGIAFICVGMAKYLEALLPAWLSWLLVGVFAALLGLLSAFASLLLLKG
ncbi:MAG: hypothetical protein QXG32_01625 [Candidatus Bathyarchaeia archaeon]